MTFRTAPQPPSAPTTPTETSQPERAVRLAAEILARSHERETPDERARSRRMDRMLNDPDGKAFTIALADQILRFNDPDRAAERFRDLLHELGLPEYLSLWQRFLLRCASLGSHILPGVVMPQVAAQVRRDAGAVILPGEDEPFHRYLQARRRQGTRVNVNQLGEAVLGEGEARRRLDEILQRLADPQVHYVSVKLSAIFSQINLVAYEHTLERVKERLRALYHAAIDHGIDGAPKFVNLDMEEYRDLDLTVDAFRQVLDEAAFEKLEAGIVLQAYLPDSFNVQQDLAEWARQRQARTGAGIKVRLVKGANLAMEKVEASLHDWPQAPYRTKQEVDANFKRMLHFACLPENLAAVRLGVASHNLFDVAYALLLRSENPLGPRIEFEMLEGMANAQAAELKERSGSMLVYAPVVRRESFQSAIAYLVRRLEENTAPENFLGHLFGLQEGSIAWETQREAFLQACHFASSPTLSATPNRRQDRRKERPRADPAGAPFENASDTDFSLLPNRQWIAGVYERWSRTTVHPVALGSIGGEDAAVTGEARDPSRPGVIAYRYAVGEDRHVDQAVEAAVKAQTAWEARGKEKRAEVLRQAAAVFARHRGDTIGCMILDGGKAAAEADTEVSEAIDFANYYARSFDDPGWRDGTLPEAIGVVLVTPPWNFPYAIPAGGCLAALMAGNSVILKPAPQTVLTARKVAEHLWEAGVPKGVLQYLPVPDDETGRRLVTDERVAGVILTGAYDTARLFQSWKPEIRLSAETSGKNSLVITQAADLDLAVKDLVKSAFNHAGQKCSAASLALVESAVYRDPLFRRQLKDAAESLAVGTAREPSSIVTPLIREPSPELQRALTTLDPGESWLLEPRMIDNNPGLWSPGIKLGVRPGSWFHRTECFGPVLGLIEVEDLNHAIAVQNDNAFGLTGGLHSLDEREIAIWKERVQVGNAYINRGTTGAIVKRQPFGGWKKSVVGNGSKAGGPNYAASFVNWKTESLPRLRKAPEPEVEGLLDRFLESLPSPEDREALRASAASYAFWWDAEFGREHDPSARHGESNHFRYRPREHVELRVTGPANALALFQVALAARTCEVPLEISLECPPPVTIAEPAATVEGDEAFQRRIKAIAGVAIRCLGPIPRSLYETVHEAAIPLLQGPVVANGRVELLHYLREQSVSETTHRHGNVLASSARGGRGGKRIDIPKLASLA